MQTPISVEIRLLENMRVIDNEICYRAKECGCLFAQYREFIERWAYVLLMSWQLHDLGALFSLQM